MSFGFGISDFIAVIELASKIWKEFVDAPSQFKNISDEWITFHSTLLRYVEVVPTELELNAQEETELRVIANSCLNVLRELEQTLDKYRELDIGSGSTRNKMRRALKRLTWKPEDIKELRSRIVENFTLLNIFQGKIYGQISLATKRSVDRLHERQDNRERHEEYQAILDWLTPVGYTKQQRDSIRRWQEGTGQWLLDSAEFQSWVETDKQKLFCSGIPGAGKTILSSVVVNYLYAKFQGDQNIGIAYLYCNFKSQQHQQPKDLIASLLKQLVQRQPSLFDSVKTLHDSHKDGPTQPSLADILSTLHCVITTFSRVYFIVDALDECQLSGGCQSRFLSALLGLQSETRANLFVTSRQILDIKEKFKGSLSHDILAREEDIQRYLNGHLSELLPFVLEEPKLQEEIKTGITKAAEGMFLLAKLYLDSLKDKTTPKDIKLALKQFQERSQGSSENKLEVLSLAYDEAMGRIKRQERGLWLLAQNVLLWITCAKKPLTSRELQHALAVDIDKPDLDKESFPRIVDMIAVCAGLVTIDEESGIIRLVHSTTQEYLEQKQRLWFLEAETKITKACVTYLSFKIFEAGFCSTDEELEARLRENALYDYAARNWGRHAHMTPALIQKDKLMLQFLESKAKVAGASQAMFTLGDYSGHSQRVPKGVKGLHLAAYFNLPHAINELLERGHDREAKDFDGRTPLMWAIRNGHETLVELLLAGGSSIHTFDMLKRTALHYAASIGQIKSMRLLMQYKADVEARDLRGQTPLLAAVCNGQMDAVEFLLDVGANQNAFDAERKSALHLSIESKSHRAIEIVELLLAHDASADMIDINNMSPLHLTIQQDRRGKDIARLLLQKGVSVDFGIQRRSWMPHHRDGAAVYELNYANMTQELHTSSFGGLTPLHFAALIGDAQMTEFFLGQGADPNALSHYQETPLQLTLSKRIQGSEYNDAWTENRLKLESIIDFADDDEYEAVATQISDTRRAVVEALLRDDRTNVTLQDAQGLSILHVVNYMDSESPHTVRRLIQKGVKPSARNLKGQTALHLASLAGNLESVAILISEGAAIEMADNEGKTAIHYAAKSSNTETIRSILGAYEGDLDFLASKDNNGRTALHYSVDEEFCSVDMIQALLDLGASASSTDDFGNSPLAHYLSHINIFVDLEVCQLLLRYGDNANSVNKAGKNLAELYAACGGVEVEVLRLFKEYNVDMNKTNSEGMTILHTIALRGSLKTEEALLFLLSNSNIRLDIMDFSGKTALQYAMEEAERERNPNTFNRKRWSRTADILRNVKFDSNQAGNWH